MENYGGSAGMGRNFSPKLENFEDSRAFVEQEETSTLESQATELRPTEWTNEKHSLYLKSMEASFVNQLYNSLDLFGSSQESWESKHKSTKQKLKSTNARSCQFKVFQDGCWSKIDFTSDEPRANNEVNSGGLRRNPWIRHYRHADGEVARNSSASHVKASSQATANELPAHHFQFQREDSIGSNAEVMGQNFTDEDLEEENSSRIHDAKRTKTSIDDISSNDQVVPFGLPQAEYVAEDHVSEG